MTTTVFVQDVNRRRFDGRLAAAAIERLDVLPDREEARAFIDRAAALMQRAGMPAEDFSPFQAELFALVASHLLPGCWGGRVPPITLAGGTHGSTNCYAGCTATAADCWTSPAASRR